MGISFSLSQSFPTMPYEASDKNSLQLHLDRSSSRISPGTWDPLPMSASHTIPILQGFLIGLVWEYIREWKRSRSLEFLLIKSTLAKKQQRTQETVVPKLPRFPHLTPFTKESFPPGQPGVHRSRQNPEFARHGPCHPNRPPELQPVATTAVG